MWLIYITGTIIEFKSLFFWVGIAASSLWFIFTAAETILEATSETQDSFYATGVRISGTIIFFHWLFYVLIPSAETIERMVNAAN